MEETWLQIAGRAAHQGKWPVDWEQWRRKGLAWSFVRESAQVSTQARPHDSEDVISGERLSSASDSVTSLHCVIKRLTVFARAHWPGGANTAALTQYNIAETGSGHGDKARFNRLVVTWARYMCYPADDGQCLMHEGGEGKAGIAAGGRRRRIWHRSRGGRADGGRGKTGVRIAVFGDNG